MAEITTMMQQYLEMKEQYPGLHSVLPAGGFLRDVQRGRQAGLPGAGPDAHHPGPEQAGPEERTPMCGVPYHSCDSYIARLIAKGYKVAICEQTEDPALAKGLVDRDIIRIITPGTVIDSSMLEEGKNNYICGMYADCPGAGAVPVRHLHRRVLCHLLSGGGGGHGPPEKRAGPLLSPGGGALRRGLAAWRACPSSCGSGWTAAVRTAGRPASAMRPPCTLVQKQFRTGAGQPAPGGPGLLCSAPGGCSPTCTRPRRPT